mmetsp:Transcript_86571/g.222994  ORF Transcript_86571/g.222994 Transcript_86571/m.222994 type:complete len:587 (-) Transcript_86571:29-1789(-)
MLDFNELADKDLALQDSEDDDAPVTGTIVPPTLLRRKEAEVQPSRPAASKPKAPIGRRMQILVLHGRQSNENLVSFQLSGFKQALGKEVDLRVLEGDMAWRYQEGVDNHDADPMSIQLSKGREFKVWFEHDTDDPRERIDFFKQQDPGVQVTYRGAEEAAERFLRHVEEEGPVDVVVGLFEGSIVVHLAVAKLLGEGKPVPWRYSAFFGPMCIRDDRLAAPFQAMKAPHPTAHVFGRSDEYRFYQRTAAGRKAPEDYYENPTVLEHAEGHQLPSPGNPRSKEIYERIVAEMRYHCGLERAEPKRLAAPPKPTSTPLKNLEDMSRRKLRVLALCGGHSCNAVMKFQSTQLKNALGKDNAEWVYHEGSKDWTWYDGEPTPSEMEEMIAKGAQLKNWYMDKCVEEVKTDRLNRDKQFDPKTDVVYDDIPEVVEDLKNFIMKEGPFDVLVGFSQGCIMANLLIGHLRKEAPGGRELYPERWKHARHGAEQMPWRISVFFSGMHVRDKRYSDLFETKSPHPTVHVFGKEDEYFSYGRDGFGNKPVEEYYEDPVVLVHDQSHEFPTAMPRAKQIYDKVCNEIWKHCGGRPEG